MQALGKLHIGRTVKEAIERDLQAELDARAGGDSLPLAQGLCDSRLVRGPDAR